MPFFGSLGILITRVLVVVGAILSEISTLLGNGLPGFFDGTIQFNGPIGMAVDSAGNVYVADQLNHRIRKITPAGVVSTLAGSSISGYADGIGTNAGFNQPTGVAVDSVGNVYVADQLNNRIRKITSLGVVTTLAGSLSNSVGYANGTGTNATFNAPRGVAVDSAGNVYVADTSNNRIRKITPAGVVSSLAGTLTNVSGMQDGTGTTARFNQPTGVAVDSAGDAYVADYVNNRIRKITSLGVVTTFAGNAAGAFADGTGTNATFNAPRGVTVDSAGNVYVADTSNHRIRTITSTGVVSTLAGSTNGYADGTGTDARFNSPYGVTVDSAGNVYVADTSNNRIRKITSGGFVTTFVGSGVSGYSDTLPTNFLFNYPAGIVVDSTGTLYVGDGNHSVRKITPTGVVSTLAGNGTTGFVNGTGVNARFNSPSGIAIDSAGTIYIGDVYNHSIRKITPAGVVTTLAGNGIVSFSPVDGTGTDARFNQPTGVAVDTAGTVYVTEYINHCIRKITPAGVVTTFAGSTDGSASFVNGTGTNARFNSPSGITLDSAGNAYVTDVSNQRIRKITPAGVVTTFAGSGTGQFADGTGTNASFWNPTYIAIDSSGNLFVADTNNHLIRKITPSGVVSTFAGTGTLGSADGTGVSASFNNPRGVVVDSSGTVYVTDENHRIRKITSAGVVTTLVGTSRGYSDGGWFVTPIGVANDLYGNLYVADQVNHRIRRITPTGVVTTLAGQTNLGQTNGTGTNASFWNPQGIAIDSTGNIYVADTSNGLVRKITFTGVVTTLASGFFEPVGITVDPTGIVYITERGTHRIKRITTPSVVVTTIAGLGVASFQDGVGTDAYFNTPSGIVADIYGNLYVADTNNHRIRRITSDGTVTTLAGQASPGYADGIGTNAQFNFPYHISINALGTLYVADQTNNRIRTVQTSTGVVSTLAGDGTAGFTASSFNSPQGITVDKFRNAYVADTNNHSIRKIANAFTLPDNNGVVTTLAGDVNGFLNGTGIGARFGNPYGIAVDLAGNVYVGEVYNHRVRKITPAGVVTTLAGSGTGTFADGTGAGASFNQVCGVAVDSDGTVYVADQINNRVRKITPAGVVTTLAGNATATFADGTGTNARFYNLTGVAIDSAGNVYVADTSNHRIRKITSAGVVTTLAGGDSGVNGAFQDGTGTSARFSYPNGIAVDLNGIVYVGDAGNHRIRKITPLGVVTTMAGSGSQSFADGTGVSASFQSPSGVAVDSVGNVYVADYYNMRVRKITPEGVVTTVAGNGIPNAYADGIGTNASIQSPRGVAVGSDMTLYVTDEYNSHRIRKIGSGMVQLPLNRAIVTTFAGSGTAGATNGTGTSASFNFPGGVAADSVGNVYVSEQTGQRIRRITPAGVVTTLAGSGTAGATNGTGTNASFNAPFGLTVDSAGNVYVAEIDNRRIRKITPAGVVTTLAGNGTNGSSDLTGTNATFGSPTAVAADSAGNIYVADQTNHRIRKITPAGVVTTIAGSTQGYANGTGTNATFWYPYGVALDSMGNLYVTDVSNQRIRKITPAGVVTTFAGSGSNGFADGTGTNASFYYPQGIGVDSAGNVYVSDFNNFRIRKISPAGVVTTLAGSATIGSTNGTGTNATFFYTQGVTVDQGGIVYVADQNNQRIRKIQ